MYFPDITTTLATTTAGIGAATVWAMPAIGALIALAIAGFVLIKVRGVFTGLGRKALGVKGRGRRGRRR